MTEVTQLRKCSKCRCNILLETYFSKNRKGEYKATCDGCLAKRKKIKAEMPKDKFKCNKTGCIYKCSNNSDLKSHIEQVHDKIKNVQCGKCCYKCYDTSHLKSHIKIVHDKIKDVACDKCDFKFSNTGHLQRHIKAVHDKIKDYQCSLCGYKCSENTTLTRHIEICTGGERGSSGEVKIKKVLNEMKIDYQYNLSHEVRSDKALLRWDFIITNYDEPIFIEYDGKQHYEPQRFGGMSEEKANEAFQKQKEHDKIKNDYCNENGYLLLRIPYTEYENIEKLVVEFIRDNTTWGAE